MDIHDRRGLKSAAAQSLAAGTSDHKRLITLYVGITLGVSLLLSVIHFLLEQQIGDTGGLSGVGMRSMLETVQSVLTLAQVAVLPFWQFGWLCTAIGLSREQRMAPANFLTGFHRFAPYLRLLLLQAAVYFVVGMVGSNIAMILFLLTPWAKPITAIYGNMLAGSLDMETFDAAMSAAMDEVMLPMSLIYLGVFLLLAAPVFYRLRFAPYCLADDPNGKALNALKQSLAITRGRVKPVLRLDLSFWWFYALELLVAAVSYLDLLLEWADITLPFPYWVSYFGAFVLSVVFQLVLYRWRKTEVDVTYAKAYDALLSPKAPQKPDSLPWSN